MSDFQKSFLAKGVGNTLFTQDEFDDALNTAKAEIMAMAIEASRTAVMMEREACAKLAEECVDIEKLPEVIRNRIPSQVKQ